MAPPRQLAAAAHRRREAAEQRVESAIRSAIRGKIAVNFQAIAAAAAVSPDFLYRHPQLRPRIEQLREQTRPERPPTNGEGLNTSSNVVRVLTRQLQEERCARKAEVDELRTALAAAHGELLKLRRELEGTRHPALADSSTTK